MGYYGKAEKATEEYKIKTAEEKIKLAILSYQASKESTTAYDELIKIEGLSFITPRDPNGGPPFTVVVDDYEFLKPQKYIEDRIEICKEFHPFFPAELGSCIISQDAVLVQIRQRGSNNFIKKEAQKWNPVLMIRKWRREQNV